MGSQYNEICEEDFISELIDTKQAEITLKKLKLTQSKRNRQSKQAEIGLKSERLGRQTT